MFSYATVLCVDWQWLQSIMVRIRDLEWIIFWLIEDGKPFWEKPYQICPQLFLKQKTQTWWQKREQVWWGGKLQTPWPCHRILEIHKIVSLNDAKSHISTQHHNQLQNFALTYCSKLQLIGINSYCDIRLRTPGLCFARPGSPVMCFPCLRTRDRMSEEDDPCVCEANL